MATDDEEPPMAVQIRPHVSAGKTLSVDESSDAVSVGVTVITGYLGAGKSTVCFRKNCLSGFLLSLIYGWCFGF